MTTEAGAASRQYFAWRARHPVEAELLDQAPPDVVSALWAAAWQAGAWDALRRNTTLGLNLAQIIQRLEELARLYADVDLERTLSAELEQSSAYWRAEGR